MLAVWYERPGPAAEVLRVGELPDPEPGAGEVRVRLTRSGINPRDGALSIPIGAPLPLERAAEAHDRVDAGSRERVLLAIPD